MNGLVSFKQTGGGVVLVAAVLLVGLANVASAQEEYEEYSPGSAPVPPECPERLTAQALADGTVALQWEAADEHHNPVLFYRVFRDGIVIGEVQGTEFVDTTPERAEAHTYRVEAHGEAWEAGITVFSECGSATVAAVPFFGGPVLGMVAAVGALGAYVALRRRAA